MRKSREILLKYRYDTRYLFTDLEVCYVDRGAPGNVTCIGGDRIEELGPYGLELFSPHGTTTIPYHRVVKISYLGHLVWEIGRNKAEEPKKPRDPAEENEDL
jgi:uncharacterized protein (UPF0248 family)